MTLAEKNFNCVKMQRDIRRAITKEFHGLSMEEMGHRLVATVHNDPVWKPIKNPRKGDSA